VGGADGEVSNRVDRERPDGSSALTVALSPTQGMPTIQSDRRGGSDVMAAVTDGPTPVPLRPGRTITGISAVLLTGTAEGDIDWEAFEAHLARTSDAGLVPAVNMDTGYVQLLDPETRETVLDRTASVCGRRFVAGAFVDDEAGSGFDHGAHVDAAHSVMARGGVPVIFPSHGLNSQAEPQLIESLAGIGTEVDRFIGFELGPMFVPHGRIYSIEAYEALLSIPQCVGAKHSSLQRRAEWERLAVRDRVRPDFSVLTGNDLAIDMVMYGSDYLLGLSTFAPDLFARRDRLWAECDPAFFELNDLLQYLGHFSFRAPVPAYRHDAAMFLHLRGWALTDTVPPGAPTRPDSDREVLRDIAERLGVI
jgi:dihydrodipicolinate synthase/N-acetylneuraminate lyase